ncbi:MAG: aminoglycoside phosphotransferase family protein [Actinobacteria bacterium]|nr:aminoglycoside phosphotransferase family protein [Actinomycetota bacterium]
MRALPADIETRALTGALADGWDFDVESVDYAAVGFGSYHWVVNDLKGTRAFVTVDDLDVKPWLGTTRESVFDGLRRAFDTAVALRDAGLGFVVAPIPTSRGETLRRLGQRHTIALFPFVIGQAGQFGHYDNDAPTAIVTMLTELHQATPAVSSVARRIDLDLPGRRQLEAGLQELNQPWSAGPFSEPARQILVRHASDLAELLGLADRLSVHVAKRKTNWVITHGEPHAGNVLRTGEGNVLVDWDTVALAPPERDLWMLMGDAAKEATVYTNATGHELDQATLNFFRLRWDLADIAAFTDVLRSPHRHNEDTAKAYDSLTSCVATRDRWAALPD